VSGHDALLVVGHSAGVYYAQGIAACRNYFVVQTPEMLERDQRLADISIASNSSSRWLSSMIGGRGEPTPCVPPK
jgi:hypothetical protein